MSVDGGRRSVLLARCAACGVPLVAGMATASLFVGLELYSRSSPLPPWLRTTATGLVLTVLIAGGAIAAVGAAVGAVLLPEHRTGTRIAGAVLYGVAGLLVYAALLFGAAEIML